MPEIDNARLVPRPGGRHPIETAEGLGSGLTDLSKTKIPVDLHRRFAVGKSPDCVSKPDVEQGREAPAFGIRVKEQGRELTRGQISSQRHCEKGAPGAPF